MGKQEKDSLYYDNVYQQGGAKKMYFKEPEATPYFAIWEKVIQMLDKTSIIADFGCGVGQFAQLAINNQINYAFGVDFSAKAIEMAKNRTGKDCFYLSNLYEESSSRIKDFNTVILLEVLEHIEDDLKVLSNLPEGVRVIFSVPNFSDPAHVRTYNNEFIKERYKEILYLAEIIPFKMRGEAIIYLCDATKIK